MSALATLVLTLSGGIASAPEDAWHPMVAPFVRFTSPQTAYVLWETRRSMPARIMFGVEGGKPRLLTGTSERNRHKVQLKDLEPGRRYTWQVVGQIRGKRLLGEQHVLDNAFNYALAPISSGPDPWGDPKAGSLAAKRARAMLAHAGTPRGYAVLWGIGDGRLALELARQSELIVVALEPDQERVKVARRGLYRSGAYGHRVTVRHVTSSASIELARWFANLVVVHDASPPSGDDDWRALWRLAHPNGGVLLVEDGQIDTERRPKVSELAGAEVDVGPGSPPLLRWVRPRLAGSGSWTHLYGQPDNTSNSGDTLLGATETGHLEVQWLGRPGPDAMTDRNPRKPSPLAAGGRVFTQGLKRIIAQDQYNGAILWTLEIPALQRVNMPRDCANWCADERYLYVAVRDRCWMVDAASGERLRSWPVAAGKADAGAFWGYIGVRSNGRILGSAVRPEAVFTNIFGGSGEAWADATSGPVTRKVCSDALFAMDPTNGERIWARRKGVVMNPTITVGGGSLFFVECRNEKVLAGKARAIERPDLWKDLWLVALDPKTGDKKWERTIAPVPGTVVFYLTWAKDTLLMLSSSKQYELYAFAASDGKGLWHQGHPWPNHHHGRHMQHPVVVGDVVYVRPCGYHIADGTLSTDKVPDGGCGTISAAANTMMFRAGTIQMWDPKSGKQSDWARLRPGCWLSTVTAGGMILAPEAGGGCSCAGWFETSVGFVPREGGVR